jgi:hypothetical protein
MFRYADAMLRYDTSSKRYDTSTKRYDTSTKRYDSMAHGDAASASDRVPQLKGRGFYRAKPRSRHDRYKPVKSPLRQSDAE